MDTPYADNKMTKVEVKVPDVVLNETTDEVNETEDEVNKIECRVTEHVTKAEGNEAKVNKFEGMIRDMVEFGYPQPEIELTMQKLVGKDIR
ncbi:unnamed protein product [Lactuca virosa]|uniref:Uncharacterized protein n=1 Tax=Lactuca virosa TaxID=75947 RepID=A0AAU9LP15_9ASTR|nr:unnamed protein product [Lactuca virosa]